MTLPRCTPSLLRIGPVGKHIADEVPVVARIGVDQAADRAVLGGDLRLDAAPRLRRSARSRSRPSPRRRAARAPRSPRAGRSSRTRADRSRRRRSTPIPIDGDVTGPLVYVNYGRPADYEELERRGISVKGAIVIARYGAVVARHQAEGRGRARRDRLPDLLRSARRRLLRRRCVSDGPDAQRGRRAARQRDGHADVSRRSADAGRRRDGRTRSASTIKDATTLTKIPVLPISYGDAQPLLAALDGPVAPADWRGGLPITYHLGPGPARVHLKVAFDWDIEAALRRHRADAGLHVSRTSGSFAATTTTRG